MWRVTSNPPSLSNEVVDLWLVDLDRGLAMISSHITLLSDIEKDRADRYVFARDRGRFIVCRAMLRKILGGYLGTSPENLVISTGRFGRPFLSGEGSELGFNVSHSRGVAVVAVAHCRKVGVDIEFIDKTFDIAGVASNVLSPAALSRLRLLPTGSQAPVFFSAWVRKEAFLKALGDGLSSSDDLHSAISLMNDKESVLRLTNHDNESCWFVTSFTVHVDFKAALVVEGAASRVRYWRLEGSLLDRDIQIDACKVSEQGK